MGKQEDIEEGTKCIIRSHLPSDMGLDLDTVSSNITKQIFRFQNSQGVVIKVDDNYHIGKKNVAVEPLLSMLERG